MVGGATVDVSFPLGVRGACHARFRPRFRARREGMCAEMVSASDGAETDLGGPDISRVTQNVKRFSTSYFLTGVAYSSRYNRRIEAEGILS